MKLKQVFICFREQKEMEKTETEVGTIYTLFLHHEKFNSVTQLWPTLCEPMDCSMTGFPVHHQLSELAQTYVHHISDAIQLSHPLWSPSPPAFNLSHHQRLFQ